MINENELISKQTLSENACFDAMASVQSVSRVINYNSFLCRCFFLSASLAEWQSRGKNRWFHFGEVKMAGKNYNKTSEQTKSTARLLLNNSAPKLIRFKFIIEFLLLFLNSFQLAVFFSFASLFVFLIYFNKFSTESFSLCWISILWQSCGA